MDEWFDRRFTGLVQWLAIIGIGAGVGFLGGLFGKGGSAIATPLLAAIGVPPIVAVASPLPATVPGTLVAYRRYRRLGIGDPDVIRTSILVGVPATIVGALATRWIGGGLLVTVTDAVRACSSASSSCCGRRRPRSSATTSPTARPARSPSPPPSACSPGCWPTPAASSSCRSTWRVLKLPIKTALACSLAVASVLAVPGTIVHAALGHIDWTVTLVFGLASIPLSSYGARVALRMRADRLERIYGAGLAVLGFVLLAGSLI